MFLTQVGAIHHTRALSGSTGLRGLAWSSCVQTTGLSPVRHVLQEEGNEGRRGQGGVP